MLKSKSTVKNLFSKLIISSSILSSSITLADSCSVSVDPLNFGNYQPFNNRHTKVKTTIYLDCNDDFAPGPPRRHAKTNVTISLSTGSSGDYNNRTMVSGSNTLSYNLYTKNNLNKIWGDGSGRTKTVSQKVNSNNQKTVKIHGKIPKLQSIPPGVYTDTIIAEISY